MRTRIGDFKTYGTEETKDGVMFTFFVNTDEDCHIALYSTTTCELTEKIFIPREYKIGNVYSVVLLGSSVKRHSYLIWQGDQCFVDAYASGILGRETWNDAQRKEKKYQVYGLMPNRAYEWKNASPQILPRDMIIYKMHMRGFTMNQSVPASMKGNYKGLIKKLDYLKNLGVTSLELQPIYDFEDVMLEKRTEIGKKGECIQKIVPTDKINYWGYGPAYYNAPKASYFGTKNCVKNCKKMIDTIHGEGMEVIMEISFEADVCEDFMLDCLWYWVKEYHVDGFHLLGCNVPMKRIAESPRLARTKIFHDNISEKLLAEEKQKKHIFLYNDGFMYVSRQMQNHMQGSMVQFTNFLRRQNDKYGFVNYIANTNGFTLWDSYSFGEKHNEQNGEQNKDGNNVNYSFNYGIEGNTKNRVVQAQRFKQMRNGLCIALLSQAVPLIRSGDEAANTQGGNNNPYCQDNEVGWTQFAKNKNTKQLTEFTKNLIRFRKEHPAIRSEAPVTLNDYKHVGTPDVSYHGREPWLMNVGDEMKAIGVLYAGAYEGREAENVYVIYNFGYDDAEIALPRSSDNRKWKLIMNTAQEETFSFLPSQLKEQKTIQVPRESISVLIS